LNQTCARPLHINRQQHQDIEQTHEEQGRGRLPTRSVWDWKAQQALFCKDCLVLHPPWWECEHFHLHLKSQHNWHAVPLLYYTPGRNFII
jgi:hypothetical protein